MGAKTTKTKVPVTMRALVQRINRKLASEGETLKATRGTRAIQSLGNYFAVNESNVVTASNIDPEAWGRDLGVLADYEEVV